MSNEYYSEFYPTPKPLIEKMLRNVRWGGIKSVLEPSAGRGDIADYVNQKLYSYHGTRNIKREEFRDDVDTIELNQDLRYVLKGKGYRVVHDDFLKFNSYKKYDLIVMNPPFSNGDVHLLHAIELQKNGGNIVCLLNAETIRKPNTLRRIELASALETYGATIEYYRDEFAGAYRSTGVEVALIQIHIPTTDHESVIISELKKAHLKEAAKLDECKTLTDAEYVNAIVSMYNFEADAGLSLIRDFKAALPYIKSSFDTRSSGSLLNLTITGVDTRYGGGALNDNDYLKQLRSKYWQELFKSSAFTNKYTSGLIQRVNTDIRNLEDYDFTVYNIKQIQIDMTNSIGAQMEESIVKLFDELSHKHHWFDETSKNVHYYNGWKTNKSYIINNKVILPLDLYTRLWGYSYANWHHDDLTRIADIEKTLQYLDGKQSNSEGIKSVLESAHKGNVMRGIECKYFKLDIYKKGTTHITFTNADILKKLNIFGSQKKGWLPPSYGKRAYSEMTDDEQDVINSYEGEASYADTLDNAEFYLSGINPVMLIGGA